MAMVLLQLLETTGESGKWEGGDFFATGAGPIRYSRGTDTPEEAVQQILTAMATEGMVLAKDIETAEGRVLCGKGTVLTDTVISRLNNMEIQHITVEGHPIPVEGEKSLAEELADLDRRFSRVTEVKPLMYLKKRLRERLIAARGQ